MSNLSILLMRYGTHCRILSLRGVTMVKTVNIAITANCSLKKTVTIHVRVCTLDATRAASSRCVNVTSSYSTSLTTQHNADNSTQHDDDQLLQAAASATVS